MFCLAVTRFFERASGCRVPVSVWVEFCYWRRRSKAGLVCMYSTKSAVGRYHCVLYKDCYEIKRITAQTAQKYKSLIYKSPWSSHNLSPLLHPHGVMYEIKQGLLDKHGRSNDKTPTDWKTGYQDLNVVKTESVAPKSDVVETNGSDPATPAAPVKRPSAEKDASEGGATEGSEAEEGSKKKKKKKKDKKDKDKKVYFFILLYFILFYWGGEAGNNAKLENIVVRCTLSKIVKHNLLLAQKLDP